MDFSSAQLDTLMAAVPDLVFDFRGLDGLDAKIDRFIQRVRTDLVDDVAVIVQGQVKQRIRTRKQSPDGTPWAPQKKPEGNPLLVKDGGLLNSIEALRSQPGEGVVTSFNKVAWYQQLGTSRGIPPRQFMGLGRDSIGELQRFIDRWVGMQE